MLLKSFSEAVRLNNTKGWKVRVKQGFTLIELLVVIAVIAILMATLYVGYNSIKGGAKVNNYVDFVTKMQGLVTRGISQCGIQQMQQVTSVQQLTQILQQPQCGVISNNVTIPTQYQDATVGINLTQIQSNSQYTLTLSGMSNKEANEVATAIDSKYGQQVTQGNPPTTPCKANSGTVTCTFGG